MGRPTKLNSETQARFLQGLKLGLTYELAASFAGVDRTSIYNWMRRGQQEEEGIYFDFFHAVKAAEGLCAAQCMGRIIKAAEGGAWQSSAWIMERRFGYSAKQEVKIGAAEDSLDGAEDLINKVHEIAQALAESPSDE